MIFYTKTQAGFSLVETLVAISILLIVIVGPMTLSMRAAKSSSFASEQVQAYFLAQEGIELAQKTRDDLLLRNFLSSGPGYVNNPWARFTSTAASGAYAVCFQASGCGLYWGNASMVVATTSCAVAGNCLLRRTTGGDTRFTHVATGNTPTLYTRTVRFTNDSPGVRVISEVTWRTGSLVASQRVQLESYLYNIYGTP
jgi:prepilin-type N-terminal cleavage/methylation domain-containing protein